MIDVTDKILKASAIAKDAHKGQFYKEFNYYTYHVEQIAYAVHNAGYDEDYIITALLHDVLEDSDKYTLEDIDDEFGDTISSAVYILTKRKGVSYENYISDVSMATIASVVKIYDAHFNLTECLKEGDLKRARKYSNVIHTLVEETV